MRLVVRHHRRDVDDATAAVTQSETDSGNETWNNPTNTNTKNDDLICKRRRRRRRRIWSEMNDDDPIWMMMMNKLGDDQTIADVYTTLRQPFLPSFRLVVVYTFNFSLY